MDKEKVLSKLKAGIIWLGATPLQNCEWIIDAVKAEYPSPTMDTAKKLLADPLADSCLIVVDSRRVDQWCGLLETHCMRYGRDYFDDIAIRHLLSPLVNGKLQKKLAVFYGNCQMHDYFDSLNMSSEFTDNYEAVYFKYLEYPRWKEDRLELLLELSNLLVYTKEGFDERFRNCKKFVQLHNPNCRTIQIPTYCFRGYFPQTNPHIQEKGEFDIVAETFNSYHREDLYLNDMIRKGMPTEEIVKKALSGTCFSAKQIQKEIAISLRLLEAMDRVSDVKIATFVAENFKRFRLFKDPVHMENAMVWFISGQILELLGFRQSAPVPQKTIHYFTELPIYPEVAEQLGLQWQEEMHLPEIRLAQGMIQVSMEEFVRRYCRFAHSAWTIKTSLQIHADQQSVKEWFPGYAP